MALFEDVRMAELLEAVEKFGMKTGRILEIGGGTGLQAKQLADLGFEVVSVDVCAPPGGTLYPVQMYDGMTLPFPKESFDLVFSSNVLEHVPHKKALLAECDRVLKSQGRQVHIVPSAVWRFWTIVAFYPNRLQKLAKAFTKKGAEAGGASKALISAARIPKRYTYLWDQPHGVDSSAFVEVVTFSARHWKKSLLHYGYDIEACGPCGVFYCGYSPILNWSMATREKLVRYFGAACTLFILNKRR